MSCRAPGRFFVGMTGFVRQHSLLCATAPFSFPAPDFFDSLPLRSDPSGLQFLDFVQQQAPGDESIEALLAGGLAFDLNACWAVNQHYACCQFVDVLAAVTTGSDKAFLDVGFPDAQRHHALAKVLFLFRANGKCAHHKILPNGLKNLKETAEQLPGRSVSPVCGLWAEGPCTRSSPLDVKGCPQGG